MEQIDPGFRVTDAQVHLNMLGHRADDGKGGWRNDFPSLGLAVGTASMDAVGIGRVIIDEWWGWDDDGQRKPNIALPGGARRHLSPLGIEAASQHPDRFKYVTWVDHRDPDLDGLLATIAADPQVAQIRVGVRGALGDDKAFERGDYDGIFAAAERHGVPLGLCLMDLAVTERCRLARPYIERHPELRIILDHCGIFPLSAPDQGGRFGDLLRPVLELAAFPNVHLKWSHAPKLAREAFPFADITAELRGAITAFGADRILWASDATVAGGHYSWAQALHYIALCPDLSRAEKQWLLGDTAAKIYRWPAA